MHILLKDSQENIIFSNMDPHCGTCAQQCKVTSEITYMCEKKEKRRRGFQKTISGTVFLCTADINYLESGRQFKKVLQIYSEMILQFQEIKKLIAKKETERVNRLFHNLTSLNGHSIQEIYALIPQDKLLKNFREQKKIVTEHLEENISGAAETILRLLKNEISVKSEFSVYRKLYDPNPVLRFSLHEIHKVILNVVTLFFQDFADRDIRVYISASNHKLKFDYDSFQVAVYHILDNAAKYAEPGSDIFVGFNSDAEKYIISFEMTSLHIEQNELNLLFEEGYSGTQAKNLGGAGSGIGMGLIKKLLNLNSAEICVKAGAPQPAKTNMVFQERKYAKNNFSIEFSSKN